MESRGQRLLRRVAAEGPAEGFRLHAHAASATCRQCPARALPGRGTARRLPRLPHRARPLALLQRAGPAAHPRWPRTLPRRQPAARPRRPPLHRQPAMPKVGRQLYEGQYLGDFLAVNGYVVFSTDAPMWGDRGLKEGQAHKAYDIVAGNIQMYVHRALSDWMHLRRPERTDFLAYMPQVDPRASACRLFHGGPTGPGCSPP